MGKLGRLEKGRKESTAMKPMRQIIEDAPPMLSLPAELHHRRLEIILWPLDNIEPDKRSLKALLLDMPNAGADSDFSRISDYGREVLSWDT